MRGPQSCSETRCSTLPADWASMPSTSQNASAKSSPSNGMRRWRPSPKRISGGWAQRTYGLSTLSAEAFLASTLDHFDWIYADPDRRSAGGASWCGWRIVRPTYRSCYRNSVASPRTSASRTPRCSTSAETFRLFGPCRTEVVSLHDECKEVVVYTDGTGPLLTAVALELGEFFLHAGRSPCNSLRQAPSIRPLTAGC